MFKVTHAFKITHAVITAAVVAGIFTVVTGPGDRMVLSAAATTTDSAGKICDGTWPYLHCGNGQANEQAVRVIRIN